MDIFLCSLHRCGQHVHRENVQLYTRHSLVAYTSPGFLGSTLCFDSDTYNNNSAELVQDDPHMGAGETSRESSAGLEELQNTTTTTTTTTTKPDRTPPMRKNPARLGWLESSRFFSLSLCFRKPCCGMNQINVTDSISTHETHSTRFPQKSHV